MPTGLQIIGDSGAVQVDESFASLALRGKGSATFATYETDPRDSATLTVTIAGEYPLLAYRSAFPVALWYVEQSGANWIFHLITAKSNAGQSLQWYVFDRPVDIGSKYGLQVFDASGRLTFDALQKYLRARDLVPTYMASVAFDGYEAKTWATIMMVTGLMSAVSPIGNPGQIEWTWNASLRFTGASVLPTGFRIDQIIAATIKSNGPSLPNYDNSPNGIVMLVDVTNY